jgi:hypothetical protein
MMIASIAVTLAWRLLLRMLLLVNWESRANARTVRDVRTAVETGEDDPSHFVPFCLVFARPRFQCGTGQWLRVPVASTADRQTSAFGVLPISSLTCRAQPSHGLQAIANSTSQPEQYRKHLQWYGLTVYAVLYQPDVKRNSSSACLAPCW